MLEVRRRVFCTMGLACRYNGLGRGWSLRLRLCRRSCLPAEGADLTEILSGAWDEGQEKSAYHARLKLPKVGSSFGDLTTAWGECGRVSIRCTFRVIDAFVTANR
jgi:hypothetical protein